MTTRTRRTRILGVAGAVLLLAGVITVVVAVRAQQHPPQPSPSAASPVSVTPDATGSTPPANPPANPPADPPAPATLGPILARSLPTHLAVPAIGVDSDLKQIGLDATNQIQTPPFERDPHAYWLTPTPTPGELGPSTLIGHVDSASYGPGVFFRLGALQPHDPISVTRADGTIAVFEVERVVEYPKAQFPTFAVYGNTDNAALRLITCGGTFDPAQHSYESNIVAYASLVSTHKA